MFCLNSVSSTVSPALSFPSTSIHGGGLFIVSNTRKFEIRWYSSSCFLKKNNSFKYYISQEKAPPTKAPLTKLKTLMPLEHSALH
jgi:hypothetical protein